LRPAQPLVPDVVIQDLTPDKRLLGEGVSASTRSDPQAKSLGEYLRAKIVDVPEALLG